MSDTALTVLLGIGAYLLGSVPTGVLVARPRGVDLRKVGSGNIGATNVGRALGRGWAAFVLVMDVAKGLIPVMAARSILVQPTPAAVAGMAFLPVLGHIFPLFLRGRGGKGVATSFGASFGVAAHPALASAGLWVVLLLAFRISSVGSLAAVIAFPVNLWLFGVRDPATFVYGGAVAALVIVRHRDNIRRLLHRQENRA